MHSCVTPVPIGSPPRFSDVVSDGALQAALMPPIYLPSSAWLEHIPFAFWLAYQHRPRCYVELGTHLGASFFAFCQAVDAFSIDARCYAVDHWRGDEHCGFYGEEVYKTVYSRTNALYSRFSTLIRATFSDTARYFDPGSVDLLHLDGLHTEDAVEKDLEAWLPKLSDRGILLLHDTNVREREFGVRLAFDRLSERYPVFEFSHGHGLGIVGVGNSLADGVADLLKASKDESARANITKFFSRLGRACADTQQLTRAHERRSRPASRMKQDTK
jgi:hypothetical protein